jgi:hypothetical protein
MVRGRVMWPLGSTAAARAAAVTPAYQACHPRLSRGRQRTSGRVLALGPRRRHGAENGAPQAGVANGEGVRHWFQE